jgi:uncharacterized membrane protein YdbT with pleckstrin-like domain
MSTTPEETLLWKGSPSQWTNFGSYLFALILLAAIVTAYALVAPQPLILVALVFPLGLLGYRWLETRTHRYEVTNERIRITTGILSRRTTELELYRVRDYTLVEPFWLRLIGRGNLIIETADRTNPQIVIRAVPGAPALKDQIRTHTERMRQLRGVRDIDITEPQ